MPRLHVVPHIVVLSGIVVSEQDNIHEHPLPNLSFGLVHSFPRAGCDLVCSYKLMSPIVRVACNRVWAGRRRSNKLTCVLFRVAALVWSFISNLAKGPPPCICIVHGSEGSEHLSQGSPRVSPLGSLSPLRAVLIYGFSYMCTPFVYIYIYIFVYLCLQSASRLPLAHGRPLVLIALVRALPLRPPGV